MSLSDFITLIGILIAIFAFIDQKERSFIINKFNFYDKILILVIFFIINILLFYDWWSDKIPTFSYIEFNNFPSPSTWVYLFSLFLIIWFFYKIYFSKFPKNNKNIIFKFYEDLLNKEEYHFIYSILNRFEKKELLKQNNESEDFIKLINLICSNYSFLQITSSYNYRLLNKSLINNCKIDSKLINNYIECQINNPNSFIYKKKFNDEDFIDFYELIKLSVNFQNIFTELINKNKVPFKNIYSFLSNLSQKSYNTGAFYNIILKRIIYKKETHEVLIFFDYYYNYINSDIKYAVESFKDITTSLIELDPFLKNEIFYDSYIIEYLKISIFFANNNKNEVENIYKDLFKNKPNSKDLLIKIHNQYEDKFNNSNNFSNILNIILN